ncbi:MAG: extracellular solute-binding protein [Anaerolineae bacterium]
MSTATKRNVSRRELLRYGATGAGAVLLAACQPTEKIVKETVPPEKVVELQTVVATAAPEARTLSVWWESWGDVYNELMKPIGKSFEEQNPGVTVEWTFQSNFVEQFLTGVAAGTVPDCNILRAENLASFALDDALLPLDAYFVQTGLKREDFVLATYDSCVWEGKMYALPGGADFMAFFYNKDAFKDAGLDPEAPPVTLDAFREYNLKLLKRDASGAIDRIGWSPDGTSLPWLCYLFGGEWYDVRSRKITADHPSNVKCLEWLAEYVNELDVNQLASFKQSLPDFWSAGNPFGSKKTAFQYDGFWTYEVLDQYAPDISYGVAFVPTLEGKPEERANYFVGGWLVAIPAQSKQAELAWSFLKHGWVDVAWKMGCDTLNGPCVVAQLDQFETCLEAKIGPENRIAPYLHVFAEIGEAATKFTPVTPVTNKLWDEVVRAYDFVTRKEKSAQEALQEVTAVVQKELDASLT